MATWCERKPIVTDNKSLRADGPFIMMSLRELPWYFMELFMHNLKGVVLWGPGLKVSTIEM